jgi:D-alanyl-D-alanine carboxypeptidase
VIILLKRLLCALCAILLLSCEYSAFAYDYGISAFAAYSMDCASGTVFYEKNAYAPVEMASTTKIMTCLLACESERLDEEVTVTKEMLDGAEGTMLYLKEGDTISLYDLVKGAMLASGNDCANAIAVFLTGSIKAFCDEMNNKGAEIGLCNTFFETPSGLDKGKHHSCARDMALLAAYAMQNEVFREIAAMPSSEITVSSKKQSIVNHNKLLNEDEGFIGVKTGFTEKAGRCLVSAYDWGGNIIISVTLNAPDDWRDHRYLVKNAKKQYKRINKTDEVMLNTVGGVSDSVKCTYTYDLITLGDIVDLKIKKYYYPIIYAPLHIGDIIGTAEIYSGGTLLYTADITAQEELYYGK